MSHQKVNVFTPGSQSAMDEANQAVRVNVVAGGGAGGTSSNFGAGFPGTGTAAGAKDSGGNMAALNLDASGNLKVAGSLSVSPTQSSTVSAPSDVTVGTSSIQILAANAARKRFVLQNTGTTTIYILFGAGVASNANFHMALRAGGTPLDGTSPIWTDTMWTGALQAISS